MAGNIRRNRNNELLAELGATQRALALQATNGSPGASGPPGPQGDPSEDVLLAPPGPRVGIDGIALLLTANSGTSTSTSATTVDTYALSGLTAQDTILLNYIIKTVTNLTAAGSIYHVTDATSLIATSALGVADRAEFAEVRIAPTQNNLSIYVVRLVGLGAVDLGSGGTTVSAVASHQQPFTTAFTSPWTIGLRHGGVTAGGTFYWSWAVYKVVGQ